MTTWTFSLAELMFQHPVVTAAVEELSRRLTSWSFRLESLALVCVNGSEFLKSTFPSVGARQREHNQIKNPGFTLNS